MAKVLKITLKTELIWKINSIRAVKSESMTNRKNNFSVKIYHVGLSNWL